MEASWPIFAAPAEKADIIPRRKNRSGKAKTRPAERQIQQGGFACPFEMILLRGPGRHESYQSSIKSFMDRQKAFIHAGLRRFKRHSHSTGEGCSAVFFLIFRPSVLPLCYPFLVVHLVHGSRAPIIEPRAKMGSHQRGGWGPVPRIEYIISGGRAQGEGTAEGLALPPR